MHLTDTHCHLYLTEFVSDRVQMMDRAISAGVDQFYLPNVDTGTIDSMLDLCSTYRGRCFPLMGLHPCSVKENWQQEILTIEEHLFKRPDIRFKGIGETGLDFYWDKTFIEVQKENFKRHIAWATELELPLIIHSRDAMDACIQMISEHKSAALRGIFHCFSGTKEQAEEIINLGFLLGIGGVVTFKNAGLDQVLESIDLRHVVLETDSPYLAPVPYRGKRNESSYLPLIAARVAAIKKTSAEEVASITSANAKQLFQS